MTKGVFFLMVASQFENDGDTLKNDGGTIKFQKVFNDGKTRTISELTSDGVYREYYKKD